MTDFEEDEEDDDSGNEENWGDEEDIACHRGYGLSTLEMSKDWESMTDENEECSDGKE